MSRSGQLLLPMLALLFLMTTALIVLVMLGRRTIWQMRADLAADAVALSSARAQAEMLNHIATLNLGGNLFYLKGHIPSFEDDLAAMHWRQVKPFNIWNKVLVATVKGYPAYVGGVMAAVSKANRVTTVPLLPIRSHLLPENIHGIIVLNIWPPAAVYHHWEHAYYVRGWSPGKAKAQPPHIALVYVRTSHARSAGKARVWLDVTPGEWEANGGFPRPRESGLRSVGVQSFYPTFSARLEPRPAAGTVVRLLDARRDG